MNTNNRQLALIWAKNQMPKEACGLVIVKAGREVFVPCRNISPWNDAFEIHPDDYVKAEAQGVVVEIFHSHCYSTPRPSEVDKTVCEGLKLKWSIVSVPNEDWFEFTPSGYRAPLVGRPWAHGHLDCYSLLRDYYKEVLAIDLPEFPTRQFEWWKKGEDLYSENFESSGFRVVDFKSLQKHDILLMQVRSPVINHGGIYLGDNLFLHHMHRRMSGRDIFDGYWRKNCLKAVRHHSL